MSTRLRLHWEAAARASPAVELTLRFLIALAIANAPYWWLGQSLFMSRAVLNVDLAVALCVLPAAPVAGIALLAVGWGADWILSQSLTYHFRTPTEFVHSIRYAATLDYKGFIGWHAVPLVLPFAIAVVLLVRITHQHKNLWRPAVAVTSLLVMVDATNGSSMLSDRGTWRYTINLAGSPVATLSALAMREPATGPLLKLRTEDTVQGLVDIPAWAAAHPDRSILFVIVESLGVPKDPALHEWVQAQWLDQGMRQRFEVRSAELPFKGSTTSGELRSLCTLAGSYRGMDAAHGADCLPARLAANGWTTVGMHGFSGQMFNRIHWWPAMGLQASVFGEAPEFQGRRCGAAFRGGCDSALIAMGAKALAPGKRFVYLLTLNTHLPVERPADGTPAPPACANPRADRDVCDHLAATAEVLRQLRSGIDTTRVAPLVVVVGDHAPPFADKLSRQAFLADKVPAVVLVPRDPSLTRTTP